MLICLLFQQHNDGGEDSQDNVDDEQHTQPQRPMRRQMRRPFFRQFYRGPSRLPPRNVDQDGNDVRNLRNTIVKNCVGFNFFASLI